MMEYLFAVLMAVLVIGLVLILSIREPKAEKKRKIREAVEKEIADEKKAIEKKSFDRKIAWLSQYFNEMPSMWRLPSEEDVRKFWVIKEHSDLHNDIKKIVQSEILNREIEQLNKQIAKNQLEMGSYKILKPKKKAGK
jgi:hypothetical protein